MNIVMDAINAKTGHARCCIRSRRTTARSEMGCESGLGTSVTTASQTQLKNLFLSEIVVVRLQSKYSQFTCNSWTELARVSIYVTKK